jgi:hypothetical protein
MGHIQLIVRPALGLSRPRNLSLRDSTHDGVPLTIYLPRQAGREKTKKQRRSGREE